MNGFAQGTLHGGRPTGAYHGGHHGACHGGMAESPMNAVGNHASVSRQPQEFPEKSSGRNATMVGSDW